jgi:hypothetical protein
MDAFHRRITSPRRAGKKKPRLGGGFSLLLVEAAGIEHALRHGDALESDGYVVVSCYVRDCYV